QAEELGIRRILVPRTSPAFSALGLVLSDHVTHGERAYIAPSSRANASAIEALFVELEAAAARAFEAMGAAASSRRHDPSLPMCYPGQPFDMPVPIASATFDDAARARAVARFHDLHEELHTYAARSEEPLVRAVRLATVAPSPPTSLAGTRSSAHRE